MSRLDHFVFRINDEEKRLIEYLSITLQRSKSDAVRFIVINAAKELMRQEKRKQSLIGRHLV